MEQQVITECLQKYVIVKNADDKKWPGLFLEDPRITGVKLIQSAYFTFAGKMAEIDVSYSDLERAQADMLKIIDFNPSGGYDICPLMK